MIRRVSMSLVGSSTMETHTSNRARQLPADPADVRPVPSLDVPSRQVHRIPFRRPICYVAFTNNGEFTMAGKFDLKKTPSGKFMFNLKAANNRVILTSELYDTKPAALNGTSPSRRTLRMTHGTKGRSR